MLGTLLRRVTVRTLDTVVERGKSSSRAPVRIAASALHRARGVVGLAVVEREAELPTWQQADPDHHMWKSDRAKLARHRVDQGIDKNPADVDVKEEADKPSTKATSGVAVKVFYTRGCPYARAALDLLRERDVPFEDSDIKGDEPTLSWLRIVTGSRLTPRIFIHGECIGGFDELRELDQSGELDKRLANKAAAKVKLPVLRPERSPFEELDDQFGDLGQETDEEPLEGEALVARVREVLDECRPMVQADGGDIELLDVRDDVVHLQLTGNCVGCPSSQATLRHGIERRLKAKIPQLVGIESPQLQ